MLVRTTRGGLTVIGARLSDWHVALLKQHTVLDTGKRSHLFSGHGLHASLASSAEVDERDVQKGPGHASAEMTLRYHRRRDKFRVNLTKAAGL